MKEDKKKICKICGKEWKYKLQVEYKDDGTEICKHDDACKESEIELKRHQNYDLSMEAVRMAGEYQRQEALNNPTTIVRDNKTGKTEQISERVLDSIRNKVQDEEAFQE